MLSTTAATVFVLFSLTTGSPVSGPNTFSDQNACNRASGVFVRNSRTNPREQFRCERFDNVVDVQSFGGANQRR